MSNLWFILFFITVVVFGVYIIVDKQLISRMVGETKEKPKVFFMDPEHGTVEDWRRNDTMVSAAHEMLWNPLMRQALYVVKAASPGNQALPPDCPVNDRIVQQAKAEGYNEAVQNLINLAIRIPDTREPEATYAPENVEQKPFNE